MQEPKSEWTNVSVFIDGKKVPTKKAVMHGRLKISKEEIDALKKKMTHGEV